MSDCDRPSQSEHRAVFVLGAARAFVATLIAALADAVVIEVIAMDTPTWVDPCPGIQLCAAVPAALYAGGVVPCSPAVPGTGGRGADKPLQRPSGYG